MVSWFCRLSSSFCDSERRFFAWLYLMSSKGKTNTPPPSLTASPSIGKGKKSPNVNRKSVKLDVPKSFTIDVNQIAVARKQLKNVGKGRSAYSSPPTAFTPLILYYTACHSSRTTSFHTFTSLITPQHTAGKRYPLASHWRHQKNKAPCTCWMVPCGASCGVSSKRAAFISFPIQR